MFPILLITGISYFWLENALTIVIIENTNTTVLIAPSQNSNIPKKNTKPPNEAIAKAAEIDANIDKTIDTPA